jgi:hypothetical protein
VRIGPALLLAALAAPAWAADEPADSAHAAEEGTRSEVMLEWDPYYTDVDWNIPLTDKPIPTIASDNEAEIYARLIEGSLVPRYMVLEASVYPMPMLGTYLKGHEPGLYRSGEIGHSGINAFQSATAGFQEPYAVSAFFGNVAKLSRPNDNREVTNMGYSGYLLSLGNKHIKDNVYVQDDWVELEWKIKGKFIYPDKKMEWSFRAGIKQHSNPNVVDVVYLSLHRSHLDFHAPLMGWLVNADFDLKLHFSQNGGKVVREEYIFGKKYPVNGRSYTPSLDIGLIWTSPDEYSGVLRDRTGSKWTLVFRPSISF